MASGYDKSPPEPPHQPETKSGVGLVLMGIIAIVLFSAFGWLFV